MGEFVMELYPDRAPITVAEFIKYVKEGQYTQTLFHRVIPGFLVQGGGYSAVDGSVKPTHGNVPNEAAMDCRTSAAGWAWPAPRRHTAATASSTSTWRTIRTGPAAGALGLRGIRSGHRGHGCAGTDEHRPHRADGRFKADAPLTHVVIQKMEMVGAAGIKQDGPKQLAPAPTGNEVLSPN